MRNWKQLIEAWERAKKEQNDPIADMVCDEVIRKLKRQNLKWDFVDIFFKALGILFVFFGVGLFYFDAMQGNLINLGLDCVTIYFGFQISKGIDK